MPNNINQVKDVCIVGLGYIGLPTALVLASNGLVVHGVDTNPIVIDELASGKASITEPGIQTLLTETLDAGTFSASNTPLKAANFLVSVPTPLDKNQMADLSYVFDAVESIIPVLEGGEVIIIESTCLPGTAEKVASHIVSARPDLSLEPELSNSIYIAHCPERVIPGNTLLELRNNSRIIGGINEKSSELARDLYTTFCQGELVVTDATTAELTKLAENSFRDLNIAFANELSDVSQSLGINVWEVIKLANRHPRVQILNPGPGVGGHCIAVDPWFIHQAAPMQSPIIRLARELNDARPTKLVQSVLDSLDSTHNARISALGLSFKANVDDLRESPAVKVVDELANALPNSIIEVVEPYISELPSSLTVHRNVSLVSTPGDLSTYAAVIVLTDHEVFKSMEVPNLNPDLVFDTRGMWNI